jgi:hypothetical protein
MLTSRIAPNPYRDNENVCIITDGERETWIDGGSKVLHFGPSPESKIKPDVKMEDRKTVSDLRALAIEQIEALIPYFAVIKRTLHPLEDNLQKNLFFYRFDDYSRPMGDDEMPPFVQISLRADGEVVSFTNTLSA